MKLDVREWILIGLLVAVGAVKGVQFLGSGDAGAAGEEVEASLNLAEAMGGADTAGYARALEPRPFTFPADHGPHPDFRTEWWYVTANLETPGGRRFGVQFTLFRSALAPPTAGVAPTGDGGATTGGGQGTGTDESTGPAGPAALSSPWRTRQVYMGHLAVSDPDGGRFLEVDRFTRGSAGLAGGEPEPLRIWMDDWSLAGGGSSDGDAPDAGPVFPLLLHASARDAGGSAAPGTAGSGTPVEVRLSLDPAKPMVLQGDRGLSQKGREAGNASYYYSFTRLLAGGEITVDGESFPVTGTAWLDREWSTSALSADQAGWDWFALQLDDGRDLMVYRLRGTDGSTDPLSEGVLVAEDGTVRRLAHDDFSLEETDRWSSPLDGTVYPSGWRVRVPSAGVDLDVDPVQEDQELNVTVRYWEGAVDVSGSHAGQGYVELTGYAGAVSPGGGSRRFKPE